jgi:RNA polymerase sigma factor (sigma-70 family)
MPLPGDAEVECQLVREARNGSDYALARLLQENYATVCRFMCKLTLDPQLAADITQDCMERVIEKFPLFDPQKSTFSTWMIAIAKNLWIDECRRRCACRRRRDAVPFRKRRSVCRRSDCADRSVFYIAPAWA